MRYLSYQRDSGTAPAPSPTLSVGWLDEDGDCINVVSDADWAECVSAATGGNAGSGNTVKIIVSATSPKAEDEGFVFVSGTSAPASTSPFAAATESVVDATNADMPMNRWRQVLDAIAAAKADKGVQAKRACTQVRANAAVFEQLCSDGGAALKKAAAAPSSEAKQLAAATQACNHRQAMKAIKQGAAKLTKTTTTAAAAATAVPSPEKRQLVAATKACLHKKLMKEIKGSIAPEIRSCTTSAYAVATAATATAAAASAAFAAAISIDEPVKLGKVLPGAPVVEGMHGPGVVQLQLRLVQMGMLPEDAIKWRYGTFDHVTSMAIKRLHRTTAGVPADCTPYKEGTFTAKTAQMMLGQICMAEAAQHVRFRRCVPASGAVCSAATAAAAADARMLFAAKKACIHKQMMHQIKQTAPRVQKASGTATAPPAAPEERQRVHATNACRRRKLMKQIRAVFTTSMVANSHMILSNHSAMIKEMKSTQLRSQVRAGISLRAAPAVVATVERNQLRSEQHHALMDEINADVFVVPEASGGALLRMVHFEDTINELDADVDIDTTAADATAADHQAALCVAWSLHLEALRAMGFADAAVTIPLLMQHKGSILKVVSDLVQVATL